MYAMSDISHIPARADAPIACDMSAARDTPRQRLDEYARLFADALIDRERRDGAVSLVFRDDPRIRATVEDLTHREAGCCPFFDYRVETIGEKLVWTITNPISSEDRAAAETMMEIFYELPDHCARGGSEAFMAIGPPASTSSLTARTRSLP
jgi:hypothetical protein